MFVSEIIKNVNTLVGNNTSTKLNYKRLEFYIDAAVDYINNELGTSFRGPSKLYEDNKYLYNTLWSDEFIGAYAEALPSPSEFPVDSIILESNLGVFLKTDGAAWLEYDITESTLPDGKTFINYLDKFDYREIPNYYIRYCLVYSIAVLFLEEEDELERQHSTYQSRVDSTILRWKQLEYSMFDGGTSMYNGLLGNLPKTEHVEDWESPYGVPTTWCK